MALGAGLDRRRIGRVQRIARRARGIGERLPLLLMAFSAVALAVTCRALLQQCVDAPAAAMDTWPIVAATVGFLVGAAAVVWQHARRLHTKVECPQRRMTEVLRCLRTGDLSPRVHLRRGDLLHELAEELNHTIEWLNENPPSGSVTGGDVIDVLHHDEIGFCEPEWSAVHPEREPEPESAHGAEGAHG